MIIDVSKIEHPYTLLSGRSLRILFELREVKGYDFRSLKAACGLTFAGAVAARQELGQDGARRLRERTRRGRRKEGWPPPLVGAE